MKIFNTILFLCFLLTEILSAQNTDLNNLDSEGRKTGYWKVFYPNGNVRYEGNFMNDKPVGELKRYYPGGILQAAMNFASDGESAYATLNYENGKLAAKGKYSGKLKDSTWNYYSQSDAHLTIKENYSYGKRHGESIKYYRNSQISEIVSFENDLRNGLWKQYFENGALRLMSSHMNDKREGLFQTWTYEGIPSVKGYYKNGVMHGQWTYFNDLGEIDILTEYNDGVLLPNEEIERRQEEFSRRVEESIGKFDETEYPNL